MDVSPETWRWIWLVIAGVLIAGEMFVAGSFILIPFGISAAVAMVMAFFGAPLILDWVVFVGLGAVLFSVFWKKSRKSMAAMESPPGAGHDRLIGALGQALEDGRMHPVAAVGRQHKAIQRIKHHHNRFHWRFLP